MASMTFQEKVNNKDVEFRVEQVGLHGGKLSVLIDGSQVIDGFEFETIHELGLAIHHANVVALLKTSKDGEVLSAMANQYTQQFIGKSAEELQAMSRKFDGRPST